MNGFPVNVRFPMHWSEMDALGHANNARFFTWFETARIAYFRAVGLEAGRPTSLGPILKKTDCEFERPVVFPAELEASARIVKLGNTSFTMEYALCTADQPDRPAARGTGIVVLIDYQSGEKLRIPDALRAKISALEQRSFD